MGRGLGRGENEACLPDQILILKHLILRFPQKFFLGCFKVGVLQEKQPKLFETAQPRELYEQTFCKIIDPVLRLGGGGL